MLRWESQGYAFTLMGDMDLKLLTRIVESTIDETGDEDRGVRWFFYRLFWIR